MNMVGGSVVHNITHSRTRIVWPNNVFFPHLVDRAGSAGIADSHMLLQHGDGSMPLPQDSVNGIIQERVALCGKNILEHRHLL